MLGLLLFVLSRCKNSDTNVALYNDGVITQVEHADSIIQELFSFKDFDSFDVAKLNYLNALDTIKNNLSALKPIAKDDTMRQAALQLVDTYNSIVQKEYSDIYTILHDTIYTPADSVRADSLMAEMYAKWQIQSEKIATLQNRFAERHKLKLNE